MPTLDVAIGVVALLALAALTVLVPARLDAERSAPYRWYGED